MDILQQLEDLKAQFATATDSKATLEATVTDLTATITAKDGELKTAQDAVTAKDAEIESLKASVIAKDADLEAIQAKVAELTATKQTAEEKAVEIVAAVGIAPVKVDASAAGTSKADAQAEYARLVKEDPIKAGLYFNANTKAIIGG